MCELRRRLAGLGGGGRMRMDWERCALHCMEGEAPLMLREAEGV